MDALSTVTLNTGNKMPVLGLGTWRLTVDTPGAIEAALRLGFRMIDTSGDYGTQPGIGEGIKRSGIGRGDLFIVTKIEETDDAYEATRANIGQLQMDYADLMLIHRPPPDSAGRELWEGLIKAKQDGLTKDIGVSNYSIGQIQELIDATGVVPAVNQIEWTPFGHSLEMLEFCRTSQMVIQAYSPLTRGRRLNDETLAGIAASYGKTPAQVLIRWNLQLGTVPIIKANRHEHIEENIEVFDFELSGGDMATLNGLNEQYSALGSLIYLG